MNLKSKIATAEKDRGRRSEREMVEEWGGADLEIRAMHLGARTRIMDTCYEMRKVKGEDGKTGMQSLPIYRKLYPALLIACVHDPEDGTPVWAEGDEEKILSYDPDVVQRLADKCLDVSGLTKEAREDVKNDSGETPNED